MISKCRVGVSPEALLDVGPKQKNKVDILGGTGDPVLGGNTEQGLVCAQELLAMLRITLGQGQTQTSVCKAHAQPVESFLKAKLDFVKQPSHS